MSVQHLVIGDARELPEVEPDSVHLVVASPPFWRPKDERIPGRIGRCASYETYLDDLSVVFGAALRALAPGCRLCVNVADQFLPAEKGGRFQVLPRHADVLVRLCALGCEFLGSILWQRTANAASTGAAAVMGSYPFPRNGIVKLDSEHLLLFRKPGEAPRRDAEVKRRSAMSSEEWRNWFSGHWTLAGAKVRPSGAVLPVEIPRRLIRMFSFEGERVLDPFAGDGATLVAAHELDREGIAVDLDAEAARRIEERLSGENAATLFDRARLEVSFRAAPTPANPALVEESTVRPARASAAKKRRRPSGIRDRLAAVLGPNRFMTRGGRHIVLLGTAPRTGKLREAARRLEHLLADRPFVLTDRRRAPLGTDEERAYVHLLDRTFVNSRLVREGLLVADRQDEDHPAHAKFVREEAAAAR